MLTKRSVDALAPGETIFDDGRGSVPGFGVRRQKGEARTFLLLYRDDAGRRRWLTIGKFGALTVEQARAIAKDRAAEIAQGRDPQAEKQASRTALTVAEMIEAYLAAAEAGTVLTRFGAPKKPSSLAVDRGTLRRHVVPLMGRKIAAKVTRTDIAVLVDRITRGATAIDERTGPRGRSIVTGGAGTAARTVSVLGGIFSWAIKRGLLDGANPVSGVERARAKTRDRVLSPAEYAALGGVLNRGTDATGRPFNSAAITLVRLLALTGARRGELEGLRWSEVDLAARCLRLADSKTGKSLRPLGAAARDALRTWGSLPDGWVFPANRGEGHYRGAVKEIARITAAAGLTDVSAHTFRHGFCSVAAELGFAEATVGAMVGHKGRSMTSRYTHSPDAVLVAAADRVSDEILKRMGAVPEAGAIIPLRRA